MATRGSAQFQNRPAGGSNGSRGGNSGGLVDDGASGDAQWLFYGMLFFAIVCFVTLPIATFILIEAKKTNVVAQDALAEAKKMRNELKPVKKEKDDE